MPTLLHLLVVSIQLKGMLSFQTSDNF